MIPTLNTRFVYLLIFLCVASTFAQALRYCVYRLESGSAANLLGFVVLKNTKATVYESKSKCCHLGFNSFEIKMAAPTRLMTYSLCCRPIGTIKTKSRHNDH